MMTPSDDASSAAPTARSDDEEDAAAFTSPANLERVIRYAHCLMSGGFMREAFGELDRVVFYLNEPRGLSAAERPVAGRVDT